MGILFYKPLYLYLAVEKSSSLIKSKTVAASLMDDALKPSKIINIRSGLDAYFSLTYKSARNASV